MASEPHDNSPALSRAPLRASLAELARASVDELAVEQAPDSTPAPHDPLPIVRTGREARLRPDVGAILLALEPLWVPGLVSFRGAAGRLRYQRRLPQPLLL